MEISDAVLGKCTSSQIWERVRNKSCFTPGTLLRTCQRTAAPTQRLFQIRKFHKFKTEDSFSVSLLLLEREGVGKLSLFAFKRTHVCLQEIGVRGRFQSRNMSNVGI